MANETAYIVKRGDTLWGLAGKYFGDPMRWKEIWHYNNKQFAAPEIRLKLKRCIDNPDLIFIGQKIYIPVGDNHRRAVRPGRSNTGKTPAKDRVRLIPYKYNIENKVFEAYLPGGFVATVTFKGAITIQSEKSISWAEFNQAGFDIKAAREYETPLNRLVSEFQLGLNEDTKQIDFACGVTIHSNMSHAPQYQAQVSVNPLTGMPVYTTTIAYPETKGKLNEFFYTAIGYSAEIKIEKQPDIARRAPKPVPLPQKTPARAPARNSGRDWAYAAGILLFIGAATVVVATVVEDIVTGVGVADDPASFALAASMTARGMALLRGGQVMATRLGVGAAMAH